MVQINDVVVSADWLNNNLNGDGVKIVDASWFMLGINRSGFNEWMEKRIPGAVFFDFDGEIKDRSSSLPHMMPSEAVFEQAVGNLGIANDDTVIVYDSSGVFSAPRVWWMFKVMGHKNVALLDGGLPAWEQRGFFIETTKPTPISPLAYKASFFADRLITKSTLLTEITDNKRKVIDVRPNDRFTGSVPEPRMGVRSGHMPNALNLPFMHLLDAGKLKDTEQLSALIKPMLASDGLNVASCGSGVTACLLALAAEYALDEVITVYDGSWSEWGSDVSLPFVNNEAP